MTFKRWAISLLTAWTGVAVLWWALGRLYIQTAWRHLPANPLVMLGAMAAAVVGFGLCWVAAARLIRPGATVNRTAGVAAVSALATIAVAAATVAVNMVLR